MTIQDEIFLGGAVATTVRPIFTKKAPKYNCTASVASVFDICNLIIVYSKLISYHSQKKKVAIPFRVALYKLAKVEVHIFEIFYI